jgi:uracil phosphoribosyltransferase
MPHVLISEHPVVRSHLSLLRAVTTPPAEFRRLVRVLSFLMAHQATADLPTRVTSVETPLGPATGQSLDASVTLVPILRAGLGMTESMLEVLPDARVCHVGLTRDENTLRPTTYYTRLPKAANGSIAFVLDPMLATGGSAVRACELLRAAGYQQIKQVSLLAAPEGIETLSRAMPEVHIHVAAIDERLNDVGFIYPGLGDAGDRQFSTFESA